MGKTELKISDNSYDWLGSGIYFWEGNARRALEWAQNAKKNPYKGRPPVEEPAVVGAVLDLGLCLNLLDAQFLALLPEAYKNLSDVYEKAKRQLPTNKSSRNTGDVLLRDLDCAVINSMHQLREQEKQPPFDSTRGVFLEGDAAYPGAAIQKQNHIQICIRNVDCVLGYFLPRAVAIQI